MSMMKSRPKSRPPPGHKSNKPSCAYSITVVILLLLCILPASFADGNITTAPSIATTASPSIAPVNVTTENPSVAPSIAIANVNATAAPSLAPSASNSSNIRNLTIAPTQHPTSPVSPYHPPDDPIKKRGFFAKFFSFLFGVAATIGGIYVVGWIISRWRYLPFYFRACLTSISELVQSVPFLQWCPRYPSPGSVRHSPLDEIIFEESDGGVGYSAGRERAERDYGGSGSFGGGGGTSFSQWIKGATERLRGRLGRDAGGSGSADLELRDPLLPMEMT
mmetsp:Transcript_14136/g.28181  ORF Transcript_14136/g.28181 Transcript_14136/m.28181 type:complete len:278 (-) Transcript_14136:411-1244(-)|eukprot:CAMPEP_0194310346 /NCGR_PEP_ID=MMETSP0171-20130528/7301_1 /TAXON_ID=218684 /ORGANISM="Corethron pennatum, Strain L29A3" /LENGTH=277 /DNA_ID=CAMNT_0039063943 /DNA_START=81 /DNA_END=914 /DNA_ORIENTATION=+